MLPTNLYEPVFQFSISLPTLFRLRLKTVKVVCRVPAHLDCISFRFQGYPTTRPSKVLNAVMPPKEDAINTFSQFVTIGWSHIAMLCFFSSSIVNFQVTSSTRKYRLSVRRTNCSQTSFVSKCGHIKKCDSPAGYAQLHDWWYWSKSCSFFTPSRQLITQSVCHVRQPIFLFLFPLASDVVCAFAFGVFCFSWLAPK